MAGAEVRDSVLDRTIVFHDAVVEDCNLDEAILGEGVELEGIDGRNALLIQNVAKE